MQDFLSFNTFITPTLLIIMYYVGALLIPVLGWYFTFWIKKAYLSEVSQAIKNRTSPKHRMIVFMIFIMIFISMQIFWRVMFEFLIAYFDMHDALIQIESSAN